MPCRAFSERLGREDPDFETGVRRLMCPAGPWKQGWSLLVRVFDVAGIIVINNKNGAADWASRFLLSSPTRSGISNPKARGPKDLLLSLVATSVDLAVGDAGFPVQIQCVSA